jgi:hypothetical protein
LIKTIHGTLTTENSWQDLAVVHVNASGVVACVGDVSDGVDECPP